MAMGVMNGYTKTRRIATTNINAIPGTANASRHPTAHGNFSYLSNIPMTLTVSHA